MWLQKIIRTFVQFARQNKGDVKKHSPVPSKIKRKNQLPYHLSQQYLTYLAKNYTGKYLIRNEIDLEENVFQYLLKSKHFVATPSIIFNLLYQPRCGRCNNRISHLFQKTYCHVCQKPHYYCRKCVSMGKITECTPLYYWAGQHYDWPQHKQPLTWEGQLTSSQEEVANELISTIKNGHMTLVWAVTGSGKTEMLYPCLTYALKRGQRICIATPRADVVRELLPRLQHAFSSISIQGLYSGSRDNDGTAQIVIATTHQLLRYRQAFDLLIIDEIDAFPFHKDKSLLFASERAVKERHALIYLTATPRTKHRTLMNIGQLNYVFVPNRFHSYPIPVPHLEFCSRLTTQLNSYELPKQFNHWLKRRTKPLRQLLIFVPTINLAVELKRSVQSILKVHSLIHHQSEVAYVTSEDKEREEKVERFREKKIYCLISTTILERGVTFPAIDVAVLQTNHVVFDEPALIQITGRAGRSPEDPLGDVIFFHDGKTDAMQAAIQTIRMMNEVAMKKERN